MTYTEKTDSYNDRRYGKPWMAIVTTSLTRDFTFIDWDGIPGGKGQFGFEAEPGTLLAYGQKDIRKGRGGVDGYQICLPDGSLPTVGDMAAGLRAEKDLEKRWRKVAQSLLAKAVNRPEHSWQIEDWAKTRNQRASRYSAMLGVPNPVTADIAEALGLVEPEVRQEVAPAQPDIDMGAFGL